MFSRAAVAQSLSDQPVCAIAVDAEEDFDWANPVIATQHSTDCMRRIGDLHDIVGQYGVRPTYLLTYPVLDDDAAMQLLRAEMTRGRCEAGVQLHPWVNPPFEGPTVPGASFAGNLAPGLEEQKITALRARFVERLGGAPTIYRAGRYGLGTNTAALLEKLGFEVDLSVAPRTISRDEGGPDYAGYDYSPFWFGEHRRILELPLCRSIVGWGGRLAAPVYRHLTTPALTRLHIPALMTRLGYAERVTLSPEGNDVAAMLRLLRHLQARGQTIFVLSFHSSSLAVGRNPYVRTQEDLHRFHDRLAGVLDVMAHSLGFQFASLSELPGRLTEAAPSTGGGH